VQIVSLCCLDRRRGRRNSVKRLVFKEDVYDAVVCLNGDIPDIDVFESYASLPLIATDGAAAQLLDIGVGADFIVGDLDSVPISILDAVRGTTEIIPDPDQDSTDFEKALRFASTQLWGRLLIVGVHGKEMEHTLNNWSVLMRNAQMMTLSAYERGRVAIPVFNSFMFESTPDELLSLIPQPSARITTSGFVWPLTDEMLTLGVREGARNRSVEGPVSVELHEGSLLFFCDARLPLSPVLEA